MSKNEIALLEKKINPLVTRAESHKIEDAEDMEVAAQMLSQMNQIGDAIEKEKQKVLAPLNQARKAELARWKPVETMYENGIQLLRQSMSEYQTESTRLSLAEAARIASRVGEGKGKLKAETAMAKIDEIEKPASIVTTDSGAVKFRTQLKIRVTNQEIIPREYLLPDMDKILADLKTGTAIPGCEIEEIQIPVNYR